MMLLLSVSGCLLDFSQSRQHAVSRHDLTQVDDTRERADERPDVPACTSAVARRHGVIDLGHGGGRAAAYIE
jgi:hypothetical protein